MSVERTAVYHTLSRYIYTVSI